MRRDGGRLRLLQLLRLKTRQTGLKTVLTHRLTDFGGAMLATSANGMAVANNIGAAIGPALGARRRSEPYQSAKETSESES
jgi:hypothetical protein